jgi:hypothetical protein
MCYICGQPTCTSPDFCESQEPFCDTCSNDTTCVQKMDSECVIYHMNTDEPSQLINLRMPNGSTVEAILEKIDSLIGSQFNIPFEPEDTITIKWTPQGAAGHAPKADVIVSPATGNTLVATSQGLFVPGSDYKVKVDQDDVPQYLEHQILGGTDGIVSNSVQKIGGILHIIPSINLLCLINKIRTDHQEEFCELVDSCKCLLSIDNLIAAFAPACPTGYVLEDGVCVSEETIAPTTGTTEVEACANFYEEYGEYGALVYTGGFTAEGLGIGATLGADLIDGNVIAITTAQVWQNNDHSTPGTSDGDNHGPVNRAGVWDCAGVGVGSLGFSVPINVPTTKTYYLGIAADDKFQVTVNGSVIIDNQTVTPGSEYYLDGGAIFRYWHIYPVNLTAGVNYIGFIGVDTGGVQSVIAAEIYDNTLAELQAAALDPDFVLDPTTFPLNENHYSNLNLIFSTRCARQPGSIFSIGVAECPDDSWSLDTTGGDPLVPPCQGINSDVEDWVCRRTITAPFSGYTVTLVWDRIPNALNYTVQQKLHSDPDSAYVDSVGSPVTDPGSGSTAELVISGLASEEMDFRVRANFADCSTDWTVVTSDAICEPVTIDDSVVLPEGVVGEPYSASIPITGGTPPYIITSQIVPDWATLEVSLTEVTITGTPDEAGTEPVEFTIANCSSGSTAIYVSEDGITTSETPTNPNPLIGTVTVLCGEGTGADCSSQEQLSLRFQLDQPLTSPLTIKIAGIQLAVNGTVRIKYGQNLIPSVPANMNAWNGGGGDPAIVTIPAGVTTYTTHQTLNNDITTFLFGSSQNFPWACFNACNGSYDSDNVVKELYFQVQSPNESIVLNFTRGSSPYSASDLLLSQIP